MQRLLGPCSQGHGLPKAPKLLFVGCTVAVKNFFMTIPGDVFAQRRHSAGTAPIITLFIPGTPLKNTHLQKHALSIQNSIWGAEFRTLGPVACIRLKKKSLVYQQGGGRVQNSGPWDPWLPVVENSRRFAQRGHSARCAPPVVSLGFSKQLVCKVHHPVPRHASRVIFDRCGWPQY